MLVSPLLNIYWHNTGQATWLGNLDARLGKRRRKSRWRGYKARSTMFLKTVALLKYFIQFFYIVLSKLIERFIIGSQSKRTGFRKCVSSTVHSSLWTAPQLERAEWILNPTCTDTVIHFPGCASWRPRCCSGTSWHWFHFSVLQEMMLWYCLAVAESHSRARKAHYL